MMKRVLSVLVAIVLTSTAFAQIPSGLGMPGMNPFSRIGGGGKTSNFHAPESWLPDSVPLRIKKFVTDYIGFYKKDTIDTTFHDFQRLRPAEHFNDVWLGNLSYAWYPNSFDQRITLRYQDFYFLNGFLQRVYLPQNNFYFRTNRPFTDLYYASSYQQTEQQAINTLHTQNVNFYTNFGLKYNTYASLDPLTGDNSSVSTLMFWLATEKPKYRYNLVLFTNTVKLLETGGVVDTSAYYDPFAPQVYYLSSTPRTHIGFRGITFNPEYVIKQIKDSIKITTQLYFQYTRHTHNYVDYSVQNHVNYYQNYYLDSTKIFDSVAYDLTLSEVNLKLQKPKINATVAAGGELQSFYYFTDYIFQPRGNKSLNFYLRAGLERKLTDNFNLTFWAKTYLVGRKQGQTNINLLAHYKIKHFHLTAQSYFFSQTPDFFLQTYTGNVNRWYNPNFINQIFWLNRFEIYSQRFNFSVQGQIWNLKNYIYFNQQGVPTQYWLPASVFVLKAYKKIHFFKIFNFKQYLTLQYSAQNQIFNLPTLMSYSSLWTDFYMFKHALEVQLGSDIYWNSGFKQYTYVPSITAFYFTDNAPMVGQIPIVNIYANFRVKRATLFFKLDYVNGYFDPVLYYAPAAHYHYPEMYYRFGARWWFKN